MQASGLNFKTSVLLGDLCKVAPKAELNWERMGQIAKRLMSTKPDRISAAKRKITSREP